jgi:hypothetical protein
MEGLTLSPWALDCGELPSAGSGSELIEGSRIAWVEGRPGL